MGQTISREKKDSEGLSRNISCIGFHFSDSLLLCSGCRGFNVAEVRRSLTDASTVPPLDNTQMSCFEFKKLRSTGSRTHIKRREDNEKRHFTEPRYILAKKYLSAESFLLASGFTVRTLLNTLESFS